MLFCAIFHRPIESLIKIDTYLDLLIGLTYYSLECEGRELPECVIRIVLTNSEVNKMAGDAVKVDVHKIVKELQPILVDVTLHSLLGE